MQKNGFDPVEGTAEYATISTATGKWDPDERGWNHSKSGCTSASGALEAFVAHGPASGFES
jgi:hypothetical protein